MKITRKYSGFTLVELIIVIAVIGILATLATVGLGGVQADARDQQRNASAVTLSEALEKYYDKHGEYPSCSVMTGSIATIQQELDVDAAVLKAPTSSSDNSVSCSDITASTVNDVYAYVGDGSSKCNGTQACLFYRIKYKEEATGEIKTIESRRQAEAVIAPTAPASTTIASITGSTATATGSQVSCTNGEAQYRVDLQVNDGAWQEGSWGSTRTRSTTAAQGSQYGFRTATRCVLQDTTEGGATVGAVNEQVRPIDKPSSPTITATATGTSTNDSVTWNWNAITCGGGSPRYSSAYFRDDSTQWRAFTADGTGLSRAITTDNQGYEYRVKVQARCVSNYTQSAYSNESSAPSFIRTIDKPGVATNFSADTVDGTQQQINGYGDNSMVFRFVRVKWTAPTCGPGTTAIRKAWGAFGNTSGGGGYSSEWTDIDRGGSVDYVEVSKSRWRGATFPINLWDWSYFSMTNPNTSNVTPIATVRTNAAYRAANETPGGWSPVNTTSPEFSRMIVVYACYNTVTQRVGYYGNYTISQRFFY